MDKEAKALAELVTALQGISKELGLMRASLEAMAKTQRATSRCSKLAARPATRPLTALGAAGRCPGGGRSDGRTHC